MGEVPPKKPESKMIDEDALQEALVLIFGYLKVQQEALSLYVVEMTAIREAVATHDPEFFALLETKRLALESQVSEVVRLQVQKLDEIIQKLKDGYVIDQSGE